METNKKILNILLKDFKVNHTITSLSKETRISRVGAWKILKKLEKENLILLNKIGIGKTNTNLINLKWDNPILEKTLNLILTEKAIKNQRWIINLSTLENKLDFLIIYGSIIHSPKQANDIDILIVTNKFKDINNLIIKIQKTQIKKIHAINLTKEEFREEIKSNKAYIEAIKKGVILFGQEEFIKFIKNITKK